MEEDKDKFKDKARTVELINYTFSLLTPHEKISVTEEFKKILSKTPRKPSPNRAGSSHCA